jgi:transposase
MFNTNVIAIDLAKSSFHVCNLTKNNKVTLDRSFTAKKMQEWLTKQAPSIIAIASKQPKVKMVAVKTVEEQGLQGIERMRKHHSDAITATGNLLRGLVYEFGITIPKGHVALKREVPLILEDAENLLPVPFRRQLANMYQVYLTIEAELDIVGKDLFNLIKQNKSCQKIMALEGIGPVNSLGLTLSLGNKGESFKNGREASACIGVTPKQYSTGGIVTLGGIGKNRGNKLLRSTLIQGSMAAIKVLKNREPKTQKEIWLKALMARIGLRRAAVALANKNIRTAWALLNHNVEYKPTAIIMA